MHTWTPRGAYDKHAVRVYDGRACPTHLFVFRARSPSVCACHHASLRAMTQGIRDVGTRRPSAEVPCSDA